MKENIQDIIKAKYSSLSKGGKKIADYITENFEKASFMTAASLGKAVSVSESTVVRFAVNIGFDGYPELQKNLQETVKNRLTSVQRMEAANRFEGGDLIEKTFSADIETLRKTRDNVSREAFAGSVAAINKARKIYILGVRSSASIASLAAFYMSYLYDVVLIDTSATSEMFEQMLNLNSRDVCIGISFPRYSVRTEKALKYAQTRGATIISITDGEMSPIASYATYLLVAKSSMVSFVDSLVAPMSLVNALVAACTMERQDELHENLEALEKIWDEYNVYNMGEGEQ